MGGAKKSWEVKCEDVFGRERVFLVEAERDSGRVVVISPAGEAGILRNFGVYELSEAIRSAAAFASSKPTQESGGTTPTLTVATPDAVSGDTETPSQLDSSTAARLTDALLIS